MTLLPCKYFSNNFSISIFIKIFLILIRDIYYNI
uniref:Uncharacterized protein n=2 Tax=Laurencieae TaxID=2008388 RepID=A0AA51NDY7_9FLOR|nr:hypothetical protein RU988_pgp198 [Laurencia elata]WMP11716.1 hypothetical protein [Laurencia sp. A25]WMP12596.1 hypothetical protein [Laurencia elata]